MKKYIMILITLLIFAVPLSVNAVDCSRCSIDNCSRCGSECISGLAGVCIEDPNNTYDGDEIPDDSKLLACGVGNKKIENIPPLLPNVISKLYTALQILIPIILVVLGSIDLVKAISAQKDDEIKKCQQIFVKRLISAALVFFVFVIVKLLISFVGRDENSNGIMMCAKCFIYNDCEVGI